jgi:hypothetical protein
VLVASKLVVSLAAIGFSAWTAFAGAPPRFLVRNSLLAPVAVSVNGAGERQLAPGDSMQVPLRRGDPLEARWHLVGPRSISGDLRGESLGGRIAVSAPHGILRSDIAAGAVAAGYLAPRVTNSTGDTLRVMLRDSANALVPCDCDVPPGASLLLGYFRDGRLKSIEARNKAGVILTWDALLQRKNSATGEVAVSVRPADFTPPRSVGPRLTPISPSSQLVAPLPTLRFLEPTLITDSTKPAADSAAKAKPAPKQRDPLGSIFQNR